MDTMHVFARDEVLPSWWANALDRTLSLLNENFQLVRADATHISVPAGADQAAAIISVGGLWRYVEATITRAHPGGAAGAYDVYVTTTANNIASSPAPYTDNTNYSFDIAIEASGVTPAIVAGTVDAYRLVGHVQWDGAQITRVDQIVPVPVNHAHTHATGQEDPIAPADIGAATASDLTAEIANRQAADTAEANARIAGDANNPTTAQKAALTGTSGTPGAGNAYVTDGDARNSNARAPTGHHASHEPGGSDPMATDAAAGTASLRSLGVGAQQAAAGNDSRLSNARAPTAHASSHQPGGSDALAVDAAAGTGSLRTLGAGAQQAAPGNDSRLSDARTPTAHAASHAPGGSDALSGITDPQIAAANKDGAAGTPGMRSLGASAGQALAGQPGAAVAVAARAHLATTQQLTNNTLTTVALDTLDFDQGTPTAMWDATNHRFVIRVAGIYVVTAIIVISSNATGDRYIQLSAGSKTYGHHQPGSSSGSADITLELVTIQQFSVGDFVSMQAQQASGGLLPLLVETALTGKTSLALAMMR